MSVFFEYLQRADSYFDELCGICGLEYEPLDWRISVIDGHFNIGAPLFELAKLNNITIDECMKRLNDGAGN